MQSKVISHFFFFIWFAELHEIRATQAVASSRSSRCYCGGGVGLSFPFVLLQLLENLQQTVTYHHGKLSISQETIIFVIQAVQRKPNYALTHPPPWVLKHASLGCTWAYVNRGPSETFVWLLFLWTTFYCLVFVFSFWTRLLTVVVLTSSISIFLDMQVYATHCSDLGRMPGFTHDTLLCVTSGTFMCIFKEA